MKQGFPPILDAAVEAFASLPGVGRRTALRLAMHLLQKPGEFTEQFTRKIARFRQDVQFCNTCGNLSESTLCNICTHPGRNHQMICVVETIRELLAIEETGQYKGVYHILGGVLNPMDGIGPDQLEVLSLLQRVQKDEIREVILAISTTIEGETTMFYLARQLAEYPVKVSTIARGVAFGGELEFADEMTLVRSIQGRIPYTMTTGS